MAGMRNPWWVADSMAGILGGPHIMLIALELSKISVIKPRGKLLFRT